MVWAPHNLFLNSAVPATQSVTTIVGADYTVTVTGSGTMTGSAGAAGVASAASPLTYTATTTTSTFTLAGSLTQIQMNRGAVATAHLTTTANRRYGIAVEYDPVTHVSNGLLYEPLATNLLLNNATLSTQSVTVTAVAHTLSFWGTGTITLTGTSTAGPLVGTGAANRVTLTFTPTAGSLTCTVSGTVSNAQLETGTVATSLIPTYGVTQTRAIDGYIVLPAAINYSATAGSWMAEWSARTAVAGNRIIGFTTGTATPLCTAGTGLTILLSDSTALTSSAGSSSVNVFRKGAAGYASGARAISYNGTAAVADAGSTTSLFNPVNIFLGGSGSGALNGYVRKVFYVPRKLSNAELAAKST
jgi:hypothetical protein